MTAGDILFFFNFCLFAFAPAVFCAVKWQLPPERTFLPSLLLNSMIYYVFAVFHITETGFPLLYAANMLLYIPALHQGRKISFRESCRRIFTPGAVILLASLLTVFCCLLNKRFFTWDAISHWGTAVKIFMLDRKLCCEYGADVLLHASYPPGTCMTSMLVHSCFIGKQFSEGLVIFSHELYNFGVLIYFFSFLNWRCKKQILVFTLLLFAAFKMMYSAGCYQLCYTDSALLLLTALAFFQAMDCREYSHFKVFSLAITTSWLFMTRNAGWGYALGVMIIFALILIRDRKQAFYADNGNLSPLKIFAAAMVFILPLLLKYSWIYQLHHYRTALRFGGNEITADALKQMFSLHGSGWPIAGNFFFRLLKEGFLPSFILIMAGGILLCWKLQDKILKRAAKITVTFFSAGFAVFCITALLYYIFEFGDIHFPSLKRYMNSFIAIPLLILLFITAKAYAGETIRKNFRILQFFNRSYIFFPLCAMIIIAASLINCRNFSQPAIYRNWREDCDKIQKYDALLNNRNVRFTAFSTSGCGLKNFCFNIMYHRQFRAVKCWDPVIDIERDGAREYSIPVSPEELKNVIGKFDYVYLDDPQEDFCRNYAELFVPGFQTALPNIRQRLFKVNSDMLLEPADF